MPVSQSEDELVEFINGAMAQLSPEALTRTHLWPLAYKMESELPRLIDAVLEIGPDAGKKEAQRRGVLLEQVAVALFAGVKAVPASGIESWRGPMGQHDLLVRASVNLHGQALQAALFGIPFEILVEAKATKGKVDVGIMHKLCGTLEGHFQNTAKVGVFLALEGISGIKRRTVSDAQLVRLLFYARSRRPVLVLDKEDLVELAQGGNLLKVLRAKLTELESGQMNEPGFSSVPLPEHLKEVFERCTVCSRATEAGPSEDGETGDASSPR